MRCDECREAISARLDGEDLPGESATVDDHLAVCAGCRAYADRAAHVTRTARTRLAVETPDLSAALLDAWDAGGAVGPGPAPDGPATGSGPDAREPSGAGPGGRGRRGLDVVRAALGALALGQLGLAVSGIVAATGSEHHGLELAGASVAHFSHESAAWNLALGVAFAWVALGGARPAPALVSMIAAFVGVLTALSVPDLVAGRVDPARLLGHVLVVAGLVLLVAHRVLVRGDGGGSSEPGRTPSDDPSAAEGPGDARRTAGRDAGRDDRRGLEPTARRTA
ncbi:zf-HC2 domain-containing protein [Pseudonocardia sp. RS010]|uniref:zf-HC2 domain-containing protein n=1 Tax=Pseudonocardia sp. RS010 TaxID=3385979 RepID=UPI0039A18D67